jgi:hypothetical protein
VGCQLPIGPALGLVPGYAVPYKPAREPASEREAEAECLEEFVAMNSFCVKHSSGTAELAHLAD